MLSLSRPQRQALSSLAVLGLFIAPTVLVAWHAWEVRRPEHRRSVARELAAELGMEVTLGGVRYPRPGEMLLNDVSLHAQDAHAPAAGRTGLFHAQSLRIVRQAGRLTIDADGVTIRAGGPRAIAAQLATVLSRRGRQGRPISFLAHTCRLASEGGTGADLGEIVGTVRPDPARPELSASWRVGTGAEAPRCEATLQRDLTTAGGRTRVVFRTLERAPLPAAVLDPFFASAAWLGTRARVEGELTLEQAGNEAWEAAFQGTLAEIDLAALAARLAPENRLQGRGKVQVDAARWADQPGRGPGWVEAHGTLTAGEGTLGRALAESLRTRLGFVPAPGIAGEGEEIAFRALGLRFDFDPGGSIRLAGGLGPEHRAGAVLIGGPRRASLLMEPAGPVVVASLIRALVPEDPSRPDALVPARFESLIMQRYLPAPASASRPGR